MPPGHRPRLSALSALRSVRETGEGRAARRLQSRQRHCRLRWRGSRVPARARNRARCARGLRMRRHPSPSSRWAVRVCLSTGRRRGRGEGRRRPQLCRRRSAGSDRVSGVEGGGASGSGAPHGHNPCHRPCRRPCHPLPPCLRRGRRWERPAGLACCPCWGRARGTHVICSNGLRDSNKK